MQIFEIIVFSFTRKHDQKKKITIICAFSLKKYVFANTQLNQNPLSY